MRIAAQRNAKSAGRKGDCAERSANRVRVKFCAKALPWCFFNSDAKAEEARNGKENLPDLGFLAGDVVSAVEVSGA